MTQKLEDYEVIGVVGSGSFGTCYKVSHKITKKIYVWKAIDYGKLTEDKKQLLVSEVNLLSKLHHPNIVQYYDRILHRETTTLYIITEWCQGGDLGALIKEKRREGSLLEERVIWKAVYQLCKALQVCHTRLSQMTLLHRDIKPANVFLDGAGNFKLGDFGLAKSEEDCCSGEAENIVGTPYYMSPEIIKGRKYDRKSDIWALGCLVYEMSSLSPPFRGPSLKQLLANILSGEYPPIPECYSSNLSTIISFMLSVKKDYRPTVEMILHHPLVVINIKSEPQPRKSILSQRKTNDKALMEIENGVKELSLREVEPVQITEDTWKERWLGRLEELRRRELSLKEREERLARRERHLTRKENSSSALLAQWRTTTLPLAPSSNRRKVKWSPRDLDEAPSEISGDAGDTSFLCPTAVKLDPATLTRPNFFRVPPQQQPPVSSSSSRSVLRSSTKHVRFQTNALSSQPLREWNTYQHATTSPPPPPYRRLAATSLAKDFIWTSQRQSQLQINKLDIRNKENVFAIRNTKIKQDLLPSTYHFSSKVYSPI